MLYIKVLNKRTKTITFTEPGEKDDFFEVEVLSTIGTGVLEISATGSGEKSYKKIYLYHIADDFY